MEDDLICAPALAFEGGKQRADGTCASYIVVSSTRHENPLDAADWGTFDVREVTSLSEATENSGLAFDDTSVFTSHDNDVVSKISVLCGETGFAAERVEYDVYIVFELDSHRRLKISHAPGAYFGISMSFGKFETLGHPENIRERIALVQS